VARGRTESHLAHSFFFSPQSDASSTRCACNALCCSRSSTEVHGLRLSRPWCTEEGTWQGSQVASDFSSRLCGGEGGGGGVWGDGAEVPLGIGISCVVDGQLNVHDCEVSTGSCLQGKPDALAGATGADGHVSESAAAADAAETPAGLLTPLDQAVGAATAAALILTTGLGPLAPNDLRSTAACPCCGGAATVATVNLSAGLRIAEAVVLVHACVAAGAAASNGTWRSACK